MCEKTSLFSKNSTFVYKINEKWDFFWEILAKSDKNCRGYHNTSFLNPIFCVELIFRGFRARRRRKTTFWTQTYLLFAPLKQQYVKISTLKQLIFLKKLRYVSDTPAKWYTRGYNIFWECELICTNRWDSKNDFRLNIVSTLLKNHQK